MWCLLLICCWEKLTIVLNLILISLTKPSSSPFWMIPVKAIKRRLSSLVLFLLHFLLPYSPDIWQLHEFHVPPQMLVVSEQPPARDCTNSSHSWCSNAMGSSGKGPFLYPKESDLSSWKAKKCRQWEADDAEMLLFQCSPSEGRCVCCALSPLKSLSATVGFERSGQCVLAPGRTEEANV